MGPWDGALGRGPGWDPHLPAALALQLPAHACCCHAGRGGCWRRMQGCSTSSQWEAAAPALAWLDTGLCEDTELLLVWPGGWGQTLWSLCDSLKHKDLPIALLARTHSAEENLDLHTPSAWALPTALPTHNPPAKAGLLCRPAARPDKAPYQARRAGRWAPEGPGGARARLRAGSGRAQVPGSIPAPGRAPARHQAQLVTRLGSAKPPGAGRPIRRQPSHGRGGVSSPCAQRAHRRSGTDTGGREKAPEGNGESKTRLAGGEQEGPRSPPPRCGVPRGIWGRPPRRGARPRCRRSASPSGETEARQPRLHAEPLALPGRETLPPAAAGMTPAPHPPPAPPCSCRNPGVRAPGRQPGPPSSPHLPPRRPRPRIPARFTPAHTFPHRGSGRPWSAAAAAPCQTSRRCPGHGRGRRIGGKGDVFSPHLFIRWVGFFPCWRQRQAVCPGSGAGGCRDPVAVPAQPRRGLWVAGFLRTQMAVSTQSSA